jgi:hypothetical protein
MAGMAASFGNWPSGNARCNYVVGLVAEVEPAMETFWDNERVPACLLCRDLLDIRLEIDFERQESRTND